MQGGYSKDMTLYNLGAKDWKYAVVDNDRECPGQHTIRTMQSTTDECYDACVADSDCEFFSVSDKEMNVMLGGGTCKLCRVKNGFASRQKSTMYSVLSPSLYLASMDYTKVNTNRACTNGKGLLKSFSNYAGDAGSCAEECRDYPGCKQFSFGKPNDWSFDCRLCDGKKDTYAKGMSLFQPFGELTPRGKLAVSESGYRRPRSRH